MAGVKYQDKFYFPGGHIYVLMDEEWGVEITGEDGIDGNLAGMGAWDFATRESWVEWGETVMNVIDILAKNVEYGIITEDQATDAIFQIEEMFMTDPIRANIIED